MQRSCFFTLSVSYYVVTVTLLPDYVIGFYIILWRINTLSAVTPTTACTSEWLDHHGTTSKMVPELIPLLSDFLVYMYLV